jgi:hypothetical protein
VLLCNGLMALGELGFNGFRAVIDRASQTNAKIFAVFGFNIGTIPTRSSLAGDLTRLETLHDLVSL